MCPRWWSTHFICFVLVTQTVTKEQIQITPDLSLLTLHPHYYLPSRPQLLQSKICFISSLCLFFILQTVSFSLTCAPSPLLPLLFLTLSTSWSLLLSLALSAHVRWSTESTLIPFFHCSHGRHASMMVAFFLFLLILTCKLLPTLWFLFTFWFIIFIPLKTSNFNYNVIINYILNYRHNCKRSSLILLW